MNILEWFSLLIFAGVGALLFILAIGVLVMIYELVNFLSKR